MTYVRFKDRLLKSIVILSKDTFFNGNFYKKGKVFDILSVDTFTLNETIYAKLSDGTNFLVVEMSLLKDHKIFSDGFVFNKPN